MSCREVNTLTVAELKDILRGYNLQTSGSKSELITRLLEYDSSGQWAYSGRSNSINEVTSARNLVSETQHPSDTINNDELAQVRHENSLLNRERELIEKELELVKRELALLRSAQSEDAFERADQTTAVNTRGRISVKSVAELLCYFDGKSEDYPTWEKQVKILHSSYQLSSDETKVLIGMRLRGKAQEWMHSRPEFLEMSFQELLKKFEQIFYHRPSKVLVRKQFQERMWAREELFEDYLHDKLIKANRIPIDDEIELVDNIIEGIPDAALRIQARMHCFSTLEALLRAFEKLTFSEASCTGNAGKKPWRETRTAVDGEHRRMDRWIPKAETKKCYNCNEPNHLSANCPTKVQGPKCFRCGQHGHIAPACPRRNAESERNVNVVTQSPTMKSCKMVKLNNHAMKALIDTASDLTLMRASSYIKIGTPCLHDSKTMFAGIGSNGNETLGKFTTEVVIDGKMYAIQIYVVSDMLLKYDLLLGADFLNTVKLTKNGSEILIAKLQTEVPVNNNVINDVPEIFHIEVEHSVIDVTHIKNATIRKNLQREISAYVPKKIREVGVRMDIVLRDDIPIYQRARRLSPSEKDTVNKQIQEWLKDGIIQPSLSDYASPIVLVKKKDGSTRLCVDYRKLNEKVVRDRYPLPLVEDQLDALQDAKVFSTLDLRNGFFHVFVGETSRKFTSFIVPDGQYEFLRMPFGLCNSPAVFTKFINAVFRDLLKQKIVLVYMDDLIIPSKDVESGMRSLETVFSVARDFGLDINWKKCSWLQSKVEFLGHIIENGTVRPSEQKTLAISKFPTPKTAKQVRSFLGLSGYFRKFIEGYSLIARPLTDLLQADKKFEFGRREIEAFDTLKTRLTEKPVLQLYKVNAETELHTDASRFGFGAILMQRYSDDGEFHPVYFASGKTTPAEMKYASYELEVLAIVRSLRKFRIYLLGIRFKIVTDCKAFSLTMVKRDLCVRVARWALQLEEFDYIIEHRPGRKMVHVDSLSRSPLMTCYAISEDQDDMTARIRKAQQDDIETRRIFELAEQGQIDEYLTRGGLLFRTDEGNIKLVVPKKLQAQLIRKIHENGHFSTTKVETLLKRDYWFPGLRSKIEKTIRNCIPCILTERKAGKQEGFLNPIPKGEEPLDTYHIDHLGPLPSTRKNYRYIFVVVDAFTKFVWLYTTKSTNTSEVLRHLEKQAIIFGNPRRIISDRGTAFTSKEFEEYCKREKIQHSLIVTGVPRGNGQVERLNRTLIPLLTKLSTTRQEEWYRHLGVVQMFLNATPQRSINTTPFNLFFGTRMRYKDDPQIQEMLEQEWAAMFKEHRDEIRTRAKENITKIQEENKKTFNKKRKKANMYEAGDLVAIKRTQLGPNLKLAAKYLGPYRIIKVLRNDRYMVKKIGSHEGPHQTSTVVDFMKPWVDTDDDIDEESDQITVAVSEGRD